MGALDLAIVTWTLTFIAVCVCVCAWCVRVRVLRLRVLAVAQVCVCVCVCVCVLRVCDVSTGERGSLVFLGVCCCLHLFIVVSESLTSSGLALFRCRILSFGVVCFFVVAVWWGVGLGWGVGWCGVWFVGGGGVWRGVWHGG